MKKILIMGLPGSGKTTLASKLVPLLKAKWVNNDKVRKAANDWDFSEEGRVRQAKRVADIAEQFKNRFKELHTEVKDVKIGTENVPKKDKKGTFRMSFIEITIISNKNDDDE